MVAQEKISNNLIPAILTTICCCLPFGIVAIVYAAKVNGLVAAGDIASAVEASKNAKKWSIIAAVAGVVLYVAIAVFYVLVFGLALMSSSTT